MDAVIFECGGEYAADDGGFDLAHAAFGDEPVSGVCGDGDEGHGADDCEG